MELTNILLVFVIAVLVVICMYIFYRFKSINEILKSSAKEELEQIISASHTSFLDVATERIKSVTQADKSEMESKKLLIDQSLVGIKEDISKVEKVITQFEKDRAEKFTSLNEGIQFIGEQAGNLTQSTQKLNEALTSSQLRGQWGERMAEDVLKMVGFQEGVNYLKQKSMENSQQRPDYTFILPGEMKLAMDVKFPLSNYLSYFEEENEKAKDDYKNTFLKDVRIHVDSLSKREYIDFSEGTMDYMLMFIPNESVYNFIHENDGQVMDYSINKKIIFCSPMTLYAMLCVVRQALDIFAMERDQQTIIDLMGKYVEQWGKYTETIETLGKRISAVQQEYDSAAKGTRWRALEKAADNIINIQTKKLS